ncbi:hypothetical protein ACROYT_G032508 [Oculina patagonica]
MDVCVKEPKPACALAQKHGEKLHKGSLVLSFVSILLTLALFLRTERVSRDANMMDLKFTQQIQHLQEALNKVTAHLDRQKEDPNIVSGTEFKRTIVRRSVDTANISDSVGIRDIRNVIKKYVTSIIVGSVCLAPGKVCLAGPPGPRGKRGPKGTRGRKGSQGLMGQPGEQGKQGMTGAFGPTGAKGEKGNTGARGHQGPKGEPGEYISAPEVTVSPTSLTVTENQTATFYCSADGNPKPRVSWRKISGVQLVNTDSHHSKLQIRIVAYNDSGKYVCTATNVLGQVQKEVKLLVEVPPQFTKIPDQVIKIKENTVASITCQAFGSPPPVIQWSKAFASLPKGRATIENDTLKITSFRLEDVGSYQCKATNKLGSVSASTAISIIQACPNDWVRHENSCYHIIDTPTLKWSDAQRTCQDLEADLAIVRSTNENNFIFDLIRKQKTVTQWGAWLGLYRKADNKFYWINNTPLVGQYSAWASGEPNGLHEKCGHMYGKGSRQGEWNDISCTCDAKYLDSAPVVLCQKKST